ncbi:MULTISPECIES: hypothetical protein [unclassified Streptomyces]|uniref:hypothetical protein n=1 Tax=unclassified Streptomyces TaxID=2593676 RepID=UPI002257D696|nr:MULTISPECIES: hypothetical protein [unclassified Streptomyces]MCX4527101.1 hypothetical protein [Streptomyces sp. NBC_01551]MCX4542323.1 hypothetical protein [Streptomyces sp. NBC_01565]
MRPSARIPSILAGLVLAAGGAFFAAPGASAAAPTSVQDCEQYLAQHGGKQPEGVGQACYEGSIGNQTSCAASLHQIGIPANTADGACRAAH